MTKYKKKIQETPGGFMMGWAWICSTTSKTLTATSPLLLYMQLTAPHKIEDFKKIENKELTPVQKAIDENPILGALLIDLLELFHIASYKNLMEKYKAGEISATLKAILEYEPAMNNEIVYAALNGGDFSEIVLQAVKDGKIDFSRYNDTDDKSPDWFLKYRLSPTPIPGYFGSLAKMNADPHGGTDGTLDTYTENIKKAIKEHIQDALNAGITTETLQAITQDIKERYPIIKRKCDTNAHNSLRNSVFPYVSERMAGFSVDVSAGAIFDLRSHASELRDLLLPGAEPLKDFYLLVNRYIANILKSQQAAENTPKRLLEKAPFLMLKNSRESNAIASVSSNMMQIAVQQELALTDEKGTPLYSYNAKAPMKSGEVIISVKETPKGGVLRPSTEKLHILFDTLYTQTGSREFKFPIDDYLELCKRTQGEITPENRRKLKQKLKQDLQRMKNTKFSANLPGCKPGEIGILNAWLPAPGNCMYIKLESLYCDSLNQRNAGIMQLPKTIFKTNEQNPHLIPIMRALCRNRTDYHNINMEAQGGRRAHTISLKTLYEWDLALPRWAKMKEKNNRQFKRDIIEPLFNAIRELNDENYIESQYVDKDGIEHTETEMKTAGIIDILDPEKWLLLYEVVGFKDDPEMIRAAAERAKDREESKIKAAAKRITKRKKQ